LNLERDFEELPSKFRLIDAEKYQEFCKEVKEVVGQFGKMSGFEVG
jgi:hypothetical protein